ncbi:hypothetical protein Tco_1469022 [Tanacetum coccineum]
MTRSSTKELFTPFKEKEREFRSSRKLLKTLSPDESRSPKFNLFSNLKEYSKEEVKKTMAQTMKQYMRKTRADYRLGIYRPKIDDKDSLDLKGQFLKELRDNTFSGSDHEDENEHIENVLEIVDLFHIPNITQDQVMLRAFPMSLTGAAIRWLRNKPSGLITTWEDLKTKTLDEILDSKGAIPSKTAADEKGPTTPKIAHSKKKAKPSKKRTTLNLVDHSKEGHIEQQLQDSSRGTMQTLRTKNKGNLWKKPSEKKGSYGPQFSKAYSYEALHIDKSIPQKEKDPWSFTLPCYINNVCFENALADLS